MKIGTFTQDEHGAVTGVIRVLGIGVLPVALEPEVSRKDGKSYFRLIADPHGDCYEIGAAFEKRKDNIVYHSVSIDSPVFNGPLNAALFQDREHPSLLNLVWDRPEKPKPDVKLETGVAEAGKTRRFVGANAATL